MHVPIFELGLIAARAGCQWNHGLDFWFGGKKIANTLMCLNNSMVMSFESLQICLSPVIASLFPVPVPLCDKCGKQKDPNWFLWVIRSHFQISMHSLKQACLHLSFNVHTHYLIIFSQPISIHSEKKVHTKDHLKVRSLSTINILSGW